jgi:hypothetical protein
MRAETLARWACVGLTAVGLSGCVQSKATIESRTADNYHADIRKLLIITQMDDTLKHSSAGDAGELFETNIASSLGKCGITAEFHERDPLALENDAAVAIRNSAPDTVMTLIWKSEQTGGRTPTFVVYSGSIIDLKSKRTVWKSEIQFKSAWSRAETLSAAIIDKLKSDTIISQSCPTPAVPVRGI